MKYSLVNNEKVEAFKGGLGTCVLCCKETVAKCGTKNINHWAHKSTIQCDSWWENETKWHREWKKKFPNEWQEVIHHDLKTGERHIADIKTPKGLIIELQNSPISSDELRSREMFYKNLIWIINGVPFEKDFHILNRLPDPKADLFQDIGFMYGRKDDFGRTFYRHSENNKNATMVLLHSITEIENEINQQYIGHHLYDWIRPRSVWQESSCRRFVDFGDNWLWEFQVYDKEGLRCVRKYDKGYFIKRANLTQ